MKSIRIDGVCYPVIESLGYVPDVRSTVIEVQTPDGPRKAVRRGGVYRFWTHTDRTLPLREALAKKARKGESDDHI